MVPIGCPCPSRVRQRELPDTTLLWTSTFWKHRSHFASRGAVPPPRAKARGRRAAARAAAMRGYWAQQTATAATATAFGAAHAAPSELQPPIACGAYSKENQLELLRLRAAGEQAQGRGSDSPALMALEAARKNNQPKAPAPKVPHGEREGPYPGMRERIVSETPYKVEKIWEVPVDAKPKAKSPRPTKESRPLGKMPVLPGRHELVLEGPFPLEKRIAELAAHAYYLWGHARYVQYLSAGSTSELLAHRLERLAKKADSAARALAHNAHIEMSSAPPGLPAQVCAAPAPFLPPPPSTSRRHAGPGARRRPPPPAPPGCGGLPAAFL
ncbi:unnamed protein product [Prorocentrum cordatum]|uniref:Uncharacterized protein n=1 Tax=Prorocentrum cordatum TaxID=2364126 RepID=A0ABN9VR29_9DINO|nr:unnamed protein product [Polarella glacialis]